MRGRFIREPQTRSSSFFITKRDTLGLREQDARERESGSDPVKGAVREFIPFFFLFLSEANSVGTKLFHSSAHAWQNSCDGFATVRFLVNSNASSEHSLKGFQVFVKDHNSVLPLERGK